MVSPVTGVSLVTGVATGVATCVTPSVPVRRESVGYAHVIILIYSTLYVHLSSICWWILNFILENMHYRSMGQMTYSDT